MWPFKGNKRQNRLIYSSPAKQIEDSLPIGCCDNGAFVMGGVGEECIKVVHLNSTMLPTMIFNEDLLEKMLQSIEKQKASSQWQDEQYIPHPTTWLHGKRWEDEVAKSQKQNSNIRQMPSNPAQNYTQRDYSEPASNLESLMRAMGEL